MDKWLHQYKTMGYSYQSISSLQLWISLISIEFMTWISNYICMELSNVIPHPTSTVTLLNDCWNKAVIMSHIKVCNYICMELPNILPHPTSTVTLLNDCWNKAVIMSHIKVCNYICMELPNVLPHLTSTVTLLNDCWNRARISNYIPYQSM